MRNLYQITLLLIVILMASTTLTSKNNSPMTSVDVWVEYRENSSPIEIHILNWDKIEFKSPNLALNDQVLPKTSDGIFTFDTEDLLDGSNSISAVPDLGPLNCVSTLDLVMLFKGLTESIGLSPTMAIAADIDKSGSVSTKDLLNMRKSILGIISPDNLAQPFLLNKTQSIDAIDMFDFNNNFNEHIFDNEELQNISKVEFELFQYGNISDAKSDFHKSSENAAISTLSMPNRRITKGEEIEISLQLTNDNIGLISGAGWKLIHPKLRLVNVHTNSSDIMWNDLESEKSSFSYLASVDQKSVSISITFKALADGLLSDLIKLDPSFQNEQINDALQSQPLELNFIQQASIDQTIKLFPNPTQDRFFIENQLPSSVYDVKLYNMLGQLVATRVLSTEPIEFNRNQFQSDHFLFVHFYNENEHIVKKMLLE